MARVKRVVRRPVLIVSECRTDVAFVMYLRSLYCCDRVHPPPPEVKPERSDGGGGDSVVDTLCRMSGGGGYDRVAALTDADRPPSATRRKALSGKRGELIVCQPCLEGLLLAILGEAVPEASHDCKARLAALGVGDLSKSATYGKHFPLAVIEEARARLEELDKLIRLFD